MEVAMDEVVGEQHLHEHVHADLGHALANFIGYHPVRHTRHSGGSIVVELAVFARLPQDGLQGNRLLVRFHQHRLIDEGSHNLGEAHAQTFACLVEREVLPKSLHVVRLNAEIRLRPHEGLQMAQGLRHSEILCTSPDGLHKVNELPEHLQVKVDQVLGTGVPHLESNLAASTARRLRELGKIDLSHAARADRLLVDDLQLLLPIGAKRLLQSLGCVSEPVRTHCILKLCKVCTHTWWQNIRAGRGPL
mmetsp:Transcript_158542/g.508648  ORF Transcript_158542/g.508648 Transcript_158542/m.508648 type:complete len:248 (+) Transcript_158542:522-1265(+)